ncbi:histidine/lysine/arginine/ornithine ABC transporter ATP-binding protein [Labrys okinawensis]|uniref:Histidine/lysine/arginine/ornithine ABC transporter ATP-binding protein n=1 Tax=Labrys okinawensis TaxID=346911 RepID=A0A2S9Q6B5_9HYPH|nr:amino acid ABC transporter ATP-binding protein [Labrys okinawensis]PRH84885.1 histidine/lysine/arginine/ornithine ABC transporter ATP-binding protein [Labrys okinawensis]
MFRQAVQHGIRAERIEKRLGGNAVLCGVNLDIRPGEILSILGSSGSGKSTLLRCLNLLTIPDRGDIWVDGEKLAIRAASQQGGQANVIDHRQARRIRASMGMVFQNFNLWPHKTVLENVTEGPVLVKGIRRDEAADRGRHYLTKVGLSDKTDAYPRHLSGGQQQRVAIARALAMEPRTLLFDEPTSALDPELVGEVLRVMAALAEEGRTMVIVTHELAFARQVSTRAAFMHQGLIEEEGVPSKFFSAPTSSWLRSFLASHR